MNQNIQTQKTFSPDQELIENRKWNDISKGTSPDTTTLTEITRTIAKDTSPDLPLAKTNNCRKN